MAQMPKVFDFGRITLSFNEFTDSMSEARMRAEQMQQMMRVIDQEILDSVPPYVEDVWRTINKKIETAPLKTPPEKIEPPPGKRKIIL